MTPAATSPPSCASAAWPAPPTRRASPGSCGDDAGPMRILALETSCDETAAAVVEDGRRILSNVVSTQAAVHAPYGGVVPELASRHHIESMCPVVEKAMADAGLEFPELDAVAVTQGPGLVGSLLVGVQAAKAIAFVHRKPLVPVHHVAGHIQAPFLDPGRGAAPRARPRRLGRAHEPLPGAGGGRLPAPRPHAGRRGGRGLRQGGEAPGPRIPRRSRDRPVGPGRRRLRGRRSRSRASRTAAPTSRSAGSRPPCSTTCAARGSLPSRIPRTSPTRCATSRVLPAGGGESARARPRAGGGGALPRRASWSPAASPRTRACETKRREPASGWVFRCSSHP